MILFVYNTTNLKSRDQHIEAPLRVEVDHTGLAVAIDKDPAENAYPDEYDSIAELAHYYSIDLAEIEATRIPIDLHDQHCQEAFRLSQRLAHIAESCQHLRERARADNRLEVCARIEMIASSLATHVRSPLILEEALTEFERLLDAQRVALRGPQ